MARAAKAGDDRVVVVTGGAAGIGAAIAEAFGRAGAFVVTVDPGVTLDGAAALEASGEPSTADRIVAAGGRARASNTSVTDAEAVHALFTGLVDEFGRLDAVVNVAGISRPSGFASGTEDDWVAVLDVHLNGYLNVLRTALPIMAAAGRGHILGVTSGSGWRPADAGSYSCAKRAVAALTWQIGRVAPKGVNVNALSPIAATRMVLAALSRQSDEGDGSGRSATGGVSLGLDAVPPPEHLGPVGAYLAGDEFAWSTGQVVFSNGSEVAWVTPPRLLEVVPTVGVPSVPRLLDGALPAVLVPAETSQNTNGGGNPRLRDALADGAQATRAVGSCVVVSDDASWSAELTGALGARGMTCSAVDATATDFPGAAAQLAAAAGSAPIDAVVVALTHGRGAGVASGTGWEHILAAHEGIADRIRIDAAWARAVADHSVASGRPVRIVTVVEATDAAGRGRAQAATQLTRAAHGATEGRVDAFAISVETTESSERKNVGALAAHLACADGSGALSGAELVVADGWLGLRSHPNAAGTVAYGGPEIPGWLDGALQKVTGADPA